MSDLRVVVFAVSSKVDPVSVVSVSVRDISKSKPILFFGSGTKIFPSLVSIAVEGSELNLRRIL